MTKKRQKFGYASSFVATDGTKHARCDGSTQTYALFGHLQDLFVEAFFDVVALQTCYVKLPFAPGMLVVIFPNKDDIWYLCALWRRVRKPGRRNVEHSQCKAVLASLATEDCREVPATKIVPCCASGSRASVTAAKAQKLMSLFEVYKAKEIGKYQTEVIATDGDAKAAVVSTRLRAHSLKRAATALGPRSAKPPPAKMLLVDDAEEEEEDDDMAAAHAAQAQRAFEQTEKKLAQERRQASADRRAAREREAALLAQLREAQKAPAHTAAHAAASTPPAPLPQAVTPEDAPGPVQGQDRGQPPSLPVSFLGGGPLVGSFRAPSAYFGNPFGAPFGHVGTLAGPPGAAAAGFGGGVTPSMASYFEQQLSTQLQQQQLILQSQQQARYFKFMAAQQFGESIYPGPR